MKQVMVVRTDLKMRKGKIAAQCCHGSIGAYKKSDKEKIRIAKSPRHLKSYNVNNIICHIKCNDNMLNRDEIRIVNHGGNVIFVGKRVIFDHIAIVYEIMRFTGARCRTRCL